jgi:hypothetical protein
MGSSMKKYRYIKLPPELVDGQIGTATCNACDIGYAIIEWMRQENVGSRVTLEIIELTDEELDALPSI